MHESRQQLIVWLGYFTVEQFCCRPYIFYVSPILVCCLSPRRRNNAVIFNGITHHHGFASLTKIKLRKSMFPAGTLVTYQAYAGSTSSVAVTAGRGLVGVWCYGCTVFPLWQTSGRIRRRRQLCL